MSHCIIAPSSALLHKSLFDEIGLFDESFEVCEDYDMWLRVACAREIGLIDKKLITKYAGHDDQLSFKHWGMDRFRVLALEKLLGGDKDEMLRGVLLQKYRVLLKGAIKYDRMSDIKKWTYKLDSVSSTE